MKHTTKKHLCQSVSRQTRIPLNKVEGAVNAILSCMTDLLAEGKRIHLRGFADFEVRVRKARPARNPRTGEVVPLPVRKTAWATLHMKLKKPVDFGTKSE